MAFLDDLFLHLKESEQKSLTPERVCEIIAGRWGGERVYIGRPKDHSGVTRETTPQQLIANGVPKTTAYRVLRRSWVRRW